MANVGWGVDHETGISVGPAFKSDPAGAKHQIARITERRDHAADLWSIRVRPPQPLEFKPGQYVSLGVRVGDRVVERPYSIVSSPFEDELEFFFELVPDGGLTPHLHKLEVGDTLLMRRQAKGVFVLDARKTRHCLISTVTGVAPFVSMARTLARQARDGARIDHRLVVIQGASRSWELAYGEELARIAREGSWQDYVATVSRPWEDPEWKGEVGRVEDVLRKHLDRHGLEPESATVYLCGHPIMIENAKGILARCGFPDGIVREEFYWVPKK